MIRKGLTHILTQFPEVSRVEVVGSHLGLQEVIQHFCPELLIINTSIEANLEDVDLKNVLPYPSNLIHLMNTPLPQGRPANQISIYDSKTTLVDKLSPYIRKVDDTDEPGKDESESDELTSRERLILKHVALGKTNKEIASSLFISIHTVISHRKNITRKLDIKSVSGLTVYAILNGIIKMEDIS